MQWLQGEFLVSDAHASLDVDVIHEFLCTSYWAKGIPRQRVETSLSNSLCFGLYHQAAQIGFARAITDRATFAYLADVFVLPAYRGRGLGKWLISCVQSHPDLKGLRRWLLATADAHDLYRSQGFSPLRNPQWFMEINDPDIYLRAGAIAPAFPVAD